MKNIEFSELAIYYDDVMKKFVPYSDQIEFLSEIVKKNNLHDSNILDVGCGTGLVAHYLNRKGYRVSGLDNSDEMLNIAIEKSKKLGIDIKYYKGDIREYKSNQKYEMVYSINQVINHILDNNDVISFFKRVDDLLNDDGIFVFDFISYSEKIVGVTNVNAINENFEYDEIKNISYDFTTQLLSEEQVYYIREDDSIKKYVNDENKRCFGMEEIRLYLEVLTGFKILSIYNSWEFIKDSSDYFFIVVAKK